MADYTIDRASNGVYEIQMAANVVVTVSAASPYPWPIEDLTVMVHSGDSPVYAKAGNAVTVKDMGATIIMAGSWASVPAVTSSTIGIISASPAVISVYRR